MMYSLYSQLNFKEKATAEKALASLQEFQGIAESINPGKRNEEKSFIVFVENNHDTDPNQPCKTIYKWPLLYPTHLF